MRARVQKLDENFEFALKKVDERQKRMAQTVNQMSRQQIEQSAREAIESNDEFEEPEFEQPLPYPLEHTPHYTVLDSFFNDVKKM